MRRVLALVLAAVLLIPVTIPVSAAGDSLSAPSVLYDSSFRSAMNTQLSLVPVEFNPLAWDAMDQLVATIGVGAFSSLASLERAAASLSSIETRFDLGSPVVTLVQILALRDPFADWVVVPHEEYGYVIGSSKTGLVLCNSAGAFPYYKPATESESKGGGKWIGSKSCDINGKVVILTADVLGNLCLTLNQAGETCSLTKWGTKYLVIAKEQYFYYCNPDGIPYVFRVDQNYAVDSPNNYYTNNEGNNIYNGGDTVNTTLIDNSSSVVWFPDGTFQYIDQLIYDESTKTYYVDAHTEYNTTNNTYVSNTYQYEYHIDYTSITYIGSTAEYDEEYHLYYELPDGRSSADLTAEDLEVLNVSMDVIPYVRSADDTSIRALYHFDGDTLDSSYWSYAGNLEWIKGASITYMEANAFNGALYLDENEHEFIVHLPGNLLSSDFTIQFRYYQSETKAPKSDSNIYIGDQLRLIFTGAEFIGSSGSLVSTSIGHWQDVCMMRKSGTLYYFVNGVCYGSVADSTVYGDQLKFTFGSTQQTYKYLDELRILNKAAYDPSGYTPSSVPFDTNLALVLPDTVTPVADEYWKFNADGNLFIDYNWDGDYLRPNLFKSGAWQYRSSGHAVPELMSGFVRLSSDSSYIPNGVHNGDPVDGFGIHFYLGDWTGSGGYFRSSSYLSSGLRESGTYTFSIMLSDGTVCSVTARLSSINAASGVFSYLPNGAAVRLSRSSYGDGDSYSYYASIYPPQGSMDIVYVELKEGSGANTGHEFVSAVAAIESEDIDKASLAVRTELEITGHQIGGVRPSLPTKGLVWALVEAGRISSLQIYNGRAWAEVDGRIWTGERWIPYYAFDVLLLKDMYDVVESDPTMNPIYTEAGFWKWLQDAWAQMLDKLDQIIVGLSGIQDDCKHEYVMSVDRESSCLVHGLYTYTCKVCGDSYTETVDAVGHSWIVTDHVNGGSGDYVFVDSVAECVDSALRYVLPDGSIYAYVYVSGELPRLPDGYVELEYIQTTGTQFLDTGIYANQDSRIVCNLRYLGGSNIFGARTSTSANNFSLRVIQNKWQAGYSGALGSASSFDVDNEWHVLDLNKNVLYVDGVRARSLTYGAFETPTSIILGGINAENAVYYGSSCYGQTQVYGNGTILGDYVPCLSPSGEIGMYDLLSGVFSAQTGPDPFVAGDVVEFNPVYEWKVVDRYNEATAGYDVLTCSVCGAMARDYGQGPVYVQVPSESGDDNWTLVDVLVVCKDGVWSFMTGIVRTAFGGLSGFVTGVDGISEFFDAYQPNRGSEIFGILEYEGADIWD